MGFFSNSRNTCPVCNKPISRRMTVRAGNVPVCMECAGKADLPDGMMKQMSLEDLRQYMDFYQKNQILRDAFAETYRFHFGLSERVLLLDTSNRLFRLKDREDALVMEASDLKSFCIMEDNIPLFEGKNGILKCCRSDIPARVSAMAPQIAQFLMQRQMFGQMEKTARSFEMAAPFRYFYVELTLTHPYWGGFRERLEAPVFCPDDPSIDAYLCDYQEEVDRLHILATNLIWLMDPNAREFRAADNACTDVKLSI